MPGISPINILGKVIFMSKQLGMPTSEEEEPPDDQMLSKSLEESDNTAPEAPSPIPPFFKAKRMNKLDTTSTNEVGQGYSDLIDAACDAVKFAVDMWKLQAKFKDLKVNAVTALGTPGCLDGPDLDIANAPSWASCSEDNWGKYKDAVANGVKTNFGDWADNVTVPGLPWYPAFAAYPGPMAAPTPNVPMPLIACISSSMTKITVPDELKSAMLDELSGPPKDDDPDKQSEAVMEGIGTVLALAFLLWLPQQQVMLVLGKGPVPTFAPPYVPVGPVVMGDNIGAPGHLMA